MSERLTLPNPQVHRTWRQQMALKQIDATTFRSLAGAPGGVTMIKNGEVRPRAFGGHVYAQAVYAASKTVDPVLVVHVCISSVTGYFCELALADEAFFYKVQVIRDGRNYSVRKVDAVQSNGKITFTNICSFKRSEEFINIQVPQDLVKKYSSVFDGKAVKDLPLKTNFKDLREAFGSTEPCLTTTFPGMITSVLLTAELHKDMEPVKRENIYAYSSIYDEDDSSDANLDACAHMYHSDRESVWGMVRNFDLLDVLDSAASLSHTMIFHTGAKDMVFRENDGSRRYFYLETGCERLSDGRGLHEGKVFDVHGNHIATTQQDGAIRLRWKDGDHKEERIRKLETGSKL